MGWLFTGGATKKDIIAEVTRENKAAGGKCLRKCLRGNHLWTVFEAYDGKKYICLFILGAHPRDFGWGYKAVEASMGPVELSCPLAYLDDVPDSGGYETAWRERVRAYHANRTPTQKITVGATLKLKNANIPEVTITSVKPLRGRYLGMLYRIPRRMIA